MNPQPVAPAFHVISGKTVHDLLAGRQDLIVGMVERAYLAHRAGRSVNPDSYFLRFPDRPRDRIIALPAHLADGGDLTASGIKWISSFPGNVGEGLPRASAVLVLNDAATGYPLACLEGSIISAARTAASAVSGAYHLNGRVRRAGRIGLVGAGLIGRHIVEFLLATGWSCGELRVHDHCAAYAETFARWAAGTAAGACTVDSSVETLVRACDLVIFATSAGEPHVHDPALFSHNPVILHVSLRDLSPEVILASHNVVDDVDHCLKADTSLHLTERRVGHRRFVRGSLADILAGAAAPPRDRPVVFSPFGMGILDLAVGHQLHRMALEDGTAQPVQNFFHELTRII